MAEQERERELQTRLEMQEYPHIHTTHTHKRTFPPTNLQKFHSQWIKEVNTLTILKDKNPYLFVSDP